MLKKFISILLSLIMILGSVNAVYAADVTQEVSYGSPICMQGSNKTHSDRLYVANTAADSNKYVTFLKYDFTEYLPYVYMSNDISFSIDLADIGAYMSVPFDLSIISDATESAVNSSSSYSVAKTSGALDNATSIFYTESTAWKEVHTTKNIKQDIIDAIESGEDNTVIVRISVPVENETLIYFTSVKLNVTYDDTVATSDAYYSLIANVFDFDSEVGVSSDAIADNFTLPSFYKGSNITWASGNENVISITDNNASVTQQLEDTEVKLTATFSYKEGSSYTQDYYVTVAKKHILDVIADEFNSSYSVTSEPLDAVTTDVNLASSYKGTNLTWTSSNINVVHPVTGKVVPSAVEDKSVILTPTISSDGDYRELNPINITVKKYDGNANKIVASDGDMATVYGSLNNYENNHDDNYLYAAQGYKPGSVLYHFRASFVKFDITNIKDTINNADSLVLNLTTATIQSEIPENERRFNIYIADNNEWDNTLTYNGALNAGMFAGTPAPYEGYYELTSNPIYSSPAVSAQTKYNTSDISAAVKDYIKENPDATHITFMLQSDYQSKYISFYGTAGNDSQKPSLEIRYNYETPSIEAVENTDGTYSAVIKTNDTINEGYNVYFAAYSTDNVLVGIDVKADIASFESGATRLTADSAKFVTQDAAKIKCIITKADGITPLWKNDELKID